LAGRCIIFGRARQIDLGVAVARDRNRLNLPARLSEQKKTVAKECADNPDTNKPDQDEMQKDPDGKPSWSEAAPRH
jgi:hypothetical protein